MRMMIVLLAILGLAFISGCRTTGGIEVGGGTFRATQAIEAAGD